MFFISYFSIYNYNYEYFISERIQKKPVQLIEQA